MSNAVVSTAAAINSDSRDYVTFKIDSHLFGIPVLQVHDVLKPMQLTRVPLARSEISGVLNLRGRIVTAINLRSRMGLPPLDKPAMSIVVEHKNELYSLQIDLVGDVMSIPLADFQAPPATLNADWLHVAQGVCQLPGQLLIILDIARLLDFTDQSAE